MFKLRRHRSTGQTVQRLLAIGAAVATTLAFAPPAGAAEDGGSSASGSGNQIGGVAYYGGSARASGNGSGCAVIGYSGVGTYSHGSYNQDRTNPGNYQEGFDIEQVIIVEEGEDGGRSVEVADGEILNGDDRRGADDRLVEPDGDAPADSTDPNEGRFRTEIVDGRFEHEGDAWGVWRVECDPENPDDYQIVAAPLSPLALIPGAIAEIEDLLPEPELELKPFDDANGWTYVQVPVDFRTTAASLEPIVITADTGGPAQIRQWITITAEPAEIVYNSGDPLAAEPEARCPADAADDPYVPETPGECSYTHLNASSVVDGGEFQAELQIIWDVTYVANGGLTGTIDVDPTVQEEDVAVAEVKAVTRTG